MDRVEKLEWAALAGHILAVVSTLAVLVLPAVWQSVPHWVLGIGIAYVLAYVVLVAIFTSFDLIWTIRSRRQQRRAEQLRKEGRADPNHKFEW